MNSYAYFNELVERLAANNPKAVQTCIEFIEADTKGIRHGRIRALMCRRLKHCTLNNKQRTRLVYHITERLRTGNFSQQFKDELRLALVLDRAYTFKVAKASQHDGREYVRRYAKWVLDHELI